MRWNNLNLESHLQSILDTLYLSIHSNLCVISVVFFSNLKSFNLRENRHIHMYIDSCGYRYKTIHSLEIQEIWCLSHLKVYLLSISATRLWAAVAFPASSRARASWWFSCSLLSTCICIWTFFSISSFSSSLIRSSSCWTSLWCWKIISFIKRKYKMENSRCINKMKGLMVHVHLTLKIRENYHNLDDTKNQTT